MNKLEYILSLNDKMSGKLKAIGINSDTALNKFAGLQSRAVQVGNNFNALGRNVTTLNDKLSLLRSERDLIPEKNIRDIRRYNTEIQNLERRITRLQTVNNGSRLKSLTGDAVRSIPGASFLMNPIVAGGAAIAGITGMALKFDEGMAKINVTAGLGKNELGQLRDRILEVGKSMHADPGPLPETFEKILSQVGEVDLSMSIFETTLKGAKAGFTETAIVADALANSISAIGANNTSAQSVMDVLIAAKRVGAGEASDYARYIPGLIADARNLGIAFNDTAGLFAFMTAKGNSAEKSAMYMQNAFTALGKSEIQKGLAGAGVQIFDKEGSIRNIADIMEELGKKVNGLSEEDRTGFLEKIGLRDAQAKTAFSILSSDNEKLRTALKATANAAGETDSAFELSKNTMQRLRDLWNDFKTSIIQVGFSFENLLKPILSVGEVFVSLLGPSLVFMRDSIISIKNALVEGNPVIWGVISSLTAYAVITNAAAIGTGVITAATWVATTATGAWTAALTFLNAAFVASPLGWVVLTIGAVVGSVVWAYHEFDVFRDTVWGLWEVFKQVFKNIGDFFGRIFAPIIETFNAVKEGRWGDAAVSAGKALYIGSGVGFVVEATKFAAEGGFTKGVWSAAALGVAASKFNTDQKKIPGTDETLPGLSDQPKVPGSEGTPPISPNTTTSAEAIATGGSKTQNFNISIGNLVEKFTVESTDSTLSVDDIRDKVLDALMRALNMSQSLVNG